MATAAVAAVHGPCLRPPPLPSSFSCPAANHISFAYASAIAGRDFSCALSASAAVSVSPATPLFVYCGRGDPKTARGKRFKHSFGNARPRNKNKGRGPARPSSPPAPPRKDSFDDNNETVELDIEESPFE